LDFWYTFNMENKKQHPIITMVIVVTLVIAAAVVYGIISSSISGSSQSAQVKSAFSSKTSLVNEKGAILKLEEETKESLNTLSNKVETSSTLFEKIKDFIKPERVTKPVSITGSTSSSKITESKTNPGTYIFDYIFEERKPQTKGEIFIDIPIKPLDKNVFKEGGGSQYEIVDNWGYPPQKNAYHKILKGRKNSRVKNIKQKIVSFFNTNKAVAADQVSGVPGLYNCRANTSVTGYFKAYFEDVAVSNGNGYDDSTYGQARREEACQVLQDISELIKLDETGVTPDILFKVDPGNLPSNALAAASSYLGYYDLQPDNGSLHKHIITQQDPTSWPGSFDAYVVTNFDPSLAWDVDSNLNSGTYDFYTVIYHEIVHALGFRSVLYPTMPYTGIAHRQGTFDLGLYKDVSLSNPFFDSITNHFLAPGGNPPSWFVTNTDVYQGIKNIPGAVPDGIRPVYSPLSWEEGSSLSHFDMTRANGDVYVMNPSIGTNVSRDIHTDEKEVLCHQGYKVSGVSGCEAETPLALDDTFIITGTDVCIEPLTNDSSFTGGVLYIQGINPTNIQPGDVITYYGSTGCSGSATSVSGSKSIKLSLGVLPGSRQMTYTIKDSISNRISYPARISFTPTEVMACENTYQYLEEWGTSGSNPGEFLDLQGFDSDSDGNIYTTEFSGNRIQKFDSNGNYVISWGSQGSGSGQFQRLWDLAVGPQDNVYVADLSNHRIQKFDSNGNYITQWGGSGSGNGQFHSAGGVDVDSSGDVYVADVRNNRIQKFDSNGNYITQWGSYGSGNGQFNAPINVAVDVQGNIYVSDKGDNLGGYQHRIQKFDSNGNFTYEIGTVGDGNGQFDGISGMHFDSIGNLYVADGGNSRIQKFDPNGNYLNQWGSQGSGSGQFIGVQGPLVDQNDNIYVGDRINSRIQKFRTECGQIEITKDSQPNGGQNLTFTRDFGNDFILDDDSDPTLDNTITFNNLPDGEYNISELPMSGFDLDSIVCADPTNDTVTNITTASTQIFLSDSISGGESVSCTFVNLNTNPQCVTPPVSMTSWWTGDINASDHLSLNDGLLQNGTIVQNGKVDNAFYFDGVNDYIKIANDPSLTPASNEFTYDFWLKTEHGGLGENALVYKDKEYSILTQGENIIFEVVHPTLGVRRIHSQDYTFPYDQWNFIAVTYSGVDEEMKIFVNGQFVSTNVTLNNTSGSFPTSIMNASMDVNLGMKEIDPTTAFKGYMDEIEFFDRVLTGVELSEIYDADVGGKCK